jgi:HD-like signal output (HDOD) protein
MAEEWNLPEYLINAIAQHHRLEGGVDPAIYLVSHIRYNQELTDTPDIEVLLEVAKKELNISQETMSPIIEEAFRDAEDLARVFI